mmetsp:Transcript_68044/g.219902  ORF Transcript_68044/g.219902 Transcript_68044/m.219902 type:complete len:464 (+) Transcript_68044:386-1777(+)
MLVQEGRLRGNPATCDAHRHGHVAAAAPVQQAAMRQAAVVPPVEGVVDHAVRVAEREVLRRHLRVPAHLLEVGQHLLGLREPSVQVGAGRPFPGERVVSRLADKVLSERHVALGDVGRLARTHDEAHVIGVREGVQEVLVPLVLGHGPDGVVDVHARLDVAVISEAGVHLVGLAGPHWRAVVVVPAVELRLRPGVRKVEVHARGQGDGPVAVLRRVGQDLPGPVLPVPPVTVGDGLQNHAEVGRLPRHVAEVAPRRPHRQPAPKVVVEHDLGPVLVAAHGVLEALVLAIELVGHLDEHMLRKLARFVLVLHIEEDLATGPAKVVVVRVIAGRDVPSLDLELCKLDDLIVLRHRASSVQRLGEPLGAHLLELCRREGELDAPELPRHPHVDDLLELAHVRGLRSQPCPWELFPAVLWHGLPRRPGRGTSFPWSIQERHVPTSQPERRSLGVQGLLVAVSHELLW